MLRGFYRFLAGKFRSDYKPSYILEQEWEAKQKAEFDHLLFLCEEIDMLLVLSSVWN